ncbi:MAG: molybdate ABC transporter substrate-binding protein [Eubacterium sp.]|nr:molybdate ABC transporter substrate-binding protein [Eubacterium sp.]
MNRKIVIMLAALTVCIFALCGCGADSSSDADSSESAAPVSSGDSTGDVATGDSDSSAEATINLYAAASLADVLNAEIELYNQTNPGVDIVLTTGSSGDLMTQIEAADGVDIDIFFSAALKQMDQLTEEGYVDSANTVNLLKNEIVLIAAKGADTSVTGFSNITDASSIALADETVPVGSYAREAFDSLGISVDDFAEVNTCSDVSAVKESVKEGSNEVGVVYYSDYYSVKDDVELVEICDQSLYSECIYPVSLVNNSAATDAQKAAAEDFLEFLQTDEAKAIFEEYMFTIYE